MPKVTTMSVDSSIATSERNPGMRHGGGDVSAAFHGGREEDEDSDSKESRLLTWVCRLNFEL